MFGITYPPFPFQGFLTISFIIGLIYKNAKTSVGKFECQDLLH